MSIIGQDDRIEIVDVANLESPLDSVVAVDVVQNNDFDIGEGVDSGKGSGIAISPYHVLTAAHVIENGQAARITLAKDVPNLPTRTTTQFPLSDTNANRSKGGALGADSRYNGKVRDGYDLGLITLSDNEFIIEPSKSVGLLAFEDPDDAKGYTVTTAGYPALVKETELDTSNNAQYILRDDNGNALINTGLGTNITSEGTAAQVLFVATGTIEDVWSNGTLKLSNTLDGEVGESGGGFWTTLEGDEPRVLGVVSFEDPGVSRYGIDSDIGKGNFAASIDTDAYSRIVEKMRNRLGVNSGNNLPENAIIGSSENDEIEGSYRRERILGNEGQDTISGGDADDRLEGGAGYDVLSGGNGNDRLQGDGANDFLDGGEGDDIAVFSEDYTVENYDYVEITGSTFGVEDKLITIEHIGGTYADGKDTLEGIEWAEFNGQQIDTGRLSTPLSLDGTENQIARRRIIPLPLSDGIKTTEYTEATDTTPSPNPNDLPTPPNVTLSAPVAMLDGDVDYTLNISPYQPNTEYNISYIIDTSASMDAGELQQAKDAYIDLTQYFIDNEIAENINFGVIQFSRYATPYFNLTASEAISTIEGLTASTNAIAGTKYNDALYQGMNFLSQSAKDALNTTNIAYFVSDGRSRTNFYDPYDQPYVYDAMNLRRFANVQAFGIDDGTNSAGGVTQSQLNFVDSNEGLIVGDASNLSSQLLKSGLANKVQSVNILLDDELVETITPEQLTDSPLGLTYEGSVDGLDVSIDAENVITAEVVFTDEAYLATTTLDYTVTAGESEAVDGEGNDIAQSEDGNEDPFERIVDGGDSDDEITLGYADRGANGGAGSDEIIGNRRDNILDGGAGNDTLNAYEGDDIITTGAGRDKVNGGSGIDTVVYDDVAWVDGSNVFLSQAGNSVSYNNTDTLTDVEFIQFSDVRISSDTLEITPVVEVAELSITEGNSDITTARLDFNLSTPAPVDVVFDYSTEDINATAGSDYSAASGSVTIPAGDSSASLNLEIIADTDDEGIETFALNYSALSGATFSNNQTEYSTVVTIENKDAILPLVLNGDDNNNFLEGDILEDSISGGNGNDTLKGLAGNDNLNGGFDNDVLNGGVDDDSLYGGEGNDTLFGDNGRDRLDGEDGNDYLYGGNDNDRAYGGNGTDVIYGEGGNDWLRGVHSHDTLYGGEGSDTLFGDNGRDRLDGEDGDDYLYGGNDNDRAYGGNGTDRLDGEDGDDYLYGGNDDDRAYGGNGQDIIHGEGGNDWLRGVHSLDTIYGGEGNDTLFGDNGNDRLDGQDGDDYLYGGNDDDRAYGGNGQDIIHGEGGNDWLRGVHSHDTLYGGEGNDTLFGDNGNDRLDGQDGNDYLYGGNDDDRAYGGNGRDIIYGEGGNDWLRGVHSHDTLYGGEGSDTLFGDNGRDVIDGQDGDDYLYGGNDNDTLSGGNGNDTFVFNTDAAFDSNDLGIDVIVDFGDGTDLINLDLTTFTALSSQAGTGFSNGGELAVVSQDERVATNDAYILYSSSTGNLFYNENGAEAGLGNGGHFATLENAAQLEANNFTLSD